LGKARKAIDVAFCLHLCIFGVKFFLFFVKKIIIQINLWVFYYHGVIFFVFYQNGVHLKRITNLGKSCQFGTTSYAQIVPIRHDFCLVILKLCQLGTTFVLSYWSRANFTRLLPYHTEVVPTWHDFCHVIICLVLINLFSSLHVL